MADFIGFVSIVLFLLFVFGVRVDLYKPMKWAWRNIRYAITGSDPKPVFKPTYRKPEPEEAGINWPPVYASRTDLPFSEIAERIVVDALTDIVKDEPHHIMQNVTLPLKNDGSSQIDVVLLSKRGVFVIEVKAFRGIIKGKVEDEHWTQSRGFNSRDFRNPLRQNQSHLHALNECIGVPMGLMHSVVVFGREGRFKDPIADNVIHLDKLRELIRAVEPNKLTDAQLIDLVGKTELQRLPQCQATDDKHIEYVKTKSAAAG